MNLNNIISCKLFFCFKDAALSVLETFSSPGKEKRRKEKLRFFFFPFSLSWKRKTRKKLFLCKGLDIASPLHKKLKKTASFFLESFFLGKTRKNLNDPGEDA
uniref:Uncharacterized protein n=1 Tax=Chaetophora sp. FACHB-2423 TaxID=2725789 RepID=A0A6H1XDR9_9CHLO|nr:hypothetical protein [Chaetophora sp. FACHB-2423]